VSNGLHSERPLQTCRQCNGQRKSPLPILTGGPQNLSRSSRQRRCSFTAWVSDVELLWQTLFWCPLPKFPVSLEKQSFHMTKGVDRPGRRICSAHLASALSASISSAVEKGLGSVRRILRVRFDPDLRGIFLRGTNPTKFEFHPNSHKDRSNPT
jgi:hypothetical protein